MPTSDKRLIAQRPAKLVPDCPRCDDTVTLETELGPLTLQCQLLPGHPHSHQQIWYMPGAKDYRDLAVLTWPNLEADDEPRRG